MAQAASFGKNVINLRDWLASKAKAASAPKKYYTSYDERNERRVDATLSAVTTALTKAHDENADQRPHPGTP